MSWEVGAQIEADRREQIYGETWGHLAPKKNIIYRGQVTYAVSCFSDGIVVLSFDLKSRKYGELESSPWFHPAIHDFLNDLPEEQRAVGQVFKFTGYFRNYEFVGKIERVYG